MIHNLGPRFDMEHARLARVRNLTLVSLCPVLVPVSPIGTQYHSWWAGIYHDPVTHEDFPQWVNIDANGEVHRQDHLPTVESFTKGNRIDYPHTHH